MRAAVRSSGMPTDEVYLSFNLLFCLSDTTLSLSSASEEGCCEIFESWYLSPFCFRLRHLKYLVVVGDGPKHSKFWTSTLKAKVNEKFEYGLFPHELEPSYSLNDHVTKIDLLRVCLPNPLYL